MINEIKNWKETKWSYIYIDEYHFPIFTAKHDPMAKEKTNLEELIIQWQKETDNCDWYFVAFTAGKIIEPKPGQTKLDHFISWKESWLKERITKVHLTDTILQKNIENYPELLRCVANYWWAFSQPTGDRKIDVIILKRTYKNKNKKDLRKTHKEKIWDWEEYQKNLR